MKISLYILSLSLIILSCSNKAEKETQPEQPIPLTTVEKDTSGLVIAFYFNDSLKEGFTYYKNIDEDVSRKNLAFQTELKRRTVELENFVSKKGAEAQQGLLSENEIMKIQQKAQRMEAELMEYQQKEKRGFWRTSDIKRRNPNKIIKILWAAFLHSAIVSSKPCLL
mgnify:CR=1 FL=1